MKAGKLRNQITIQQVTETRDSVGGIVESWATFGTAWASVEPFSGREYFASQQRQSAETHTIRFRHLIGVTTKMRVSWGSRVFDIKSVGNVEERGRETVLICEERGV